jgi:lactate oxidase
MPTTPYVGAAGLQALSVINLRELEALAEQVIPAGGFAYISSGAGDEWTMRENEAAFQRLPLEPQYLSGVATPDLTTTVLGSQLAAPIMVPPMGAHGLAHTCCEVGTAQGAGAAGCLMIASTHSNNSMEEIAAATVGAKWFQLYFPQDRGVAREWLQRARAAGYTAIVVTLDSVITSNRERRMRAQFNIPEELGKGNVPRSVTVADPFAYKRDLDWDDIAFVQEVCGLPVILKGVLTPALAAQALQRNIDGVYVSNHGGRGLDGVPAAITALPRVADVIGGRIPIILDGGVRRGQDVFRALALGASAVAVGRPVLYGLALGGWMGAQSVLDHLKRELAMVMHFAGTPDIGAITRDFLAPQ